ncbi:MAG: T9SS type A sorting domain-containing protein, partial [Saprospiraceae bacterium]|nr:T9SS type A sorting domain-containing protein [Saprospiraceae bacterium]
VDCSYDDSGTSLPVTFGQIYLKQDDGVIINWSTKSELNNDYFSIERSKDGIKWTEIGSINGLGTSQVENEYAYWDSKPLNGISHYRIKQVDFDNSFSYSEIVSYTNPLSTSSVLLRTATEELIIDNEDEHNIFTVSNMSGQVILSGKLNKGRNLISVPELQPGVHIVTISGIIAQSFKVISF